MKKFILSAVLLAAGVCLAAADQEAWSREARSRWNIFQLGFLSGVPSETAHSVTYGVKLGAPICDGAPVVGVEGSVLFSGSKSVTGFQGSLVATKSQEVTGLQFAPVNFSVDCFGLQLGIVNVADGKTCQLGIVNYCKDALLPWTIVFNVNF